MRLTGWLLFLVLVLPAAAAPAAEPGAPYPGSDQDRRVGRESGPALFQATLQITAWDDTRLFTEKGDFEWGIGLGAEEKARLKEAARTLTGKKALITYVKRDDHPFPQVKNIEPAPQQGPRKLDVRQGLAGKSGQGVLTHIFTLFKTRDDFVRAFTAEPVPGKKPEVTVYITFALNRADITGEKSIKQLDEAGKALSLPELAAFTFEISGHTDSTGDETYNQNLSQKRAEAVRDYLVKNFSVRADNLKTAGYGESRPVAPNDTPQGRAKNRRVVFTRLD